MPAVHTVTHAPIPTTVITELTERVAGRVLTPGYAGYREATQLFNAAVDNDPRASSKRGPRPTLPQRSGSPANTTSTSP